MTLIETLLSNVYHIVVFIIFLGILVTVHEWGHFITAKKLGVEVKEFAIGFGPTLLSKFYNGTQYMVKILPLGGYVKMSGDERESCTGASNEFFSKPVGHRALIVFNGPMINFVLAYLCFAVVFMLGSPDYATIVGDFAQDSPAQVAGLQVGDTLTSIDDQKLYGWSDLEQKIKKSTGETIRLTWERDGKTHISEVLPHVVREKNIFGELEDKRQLGVQPYVPNRVGALVKGYPAQKAGLKKGDEIVVVNGTLVHNWPQVVEAIKNTTTELVSVQVRRNGELETLNIYPRMKIVKNATGEEELIPQIGISPPSYNQLYRFGVGESLMKGLKQVGGVTLATYRAVYSMIMGSMSAKDNMAGPVGIFNIVAEFSEEGLVHFLLILGVISANLAIFNLFPILPLDGGHLFLQGIEKILGRPLPEKFEMGVANIGLGLIILLALFVFYVDFERIGLIAKIQQLFH